MKRKGSEVQGSTFRVEQRTQNRRIIRLKRTEYIPSTFALRQKLLALEPLNPEPLNGYNETATQLASTFEALITHADLKIRRAAPMPVQIVQRLDATLAKYETLDWEAPVCGAIML